MPNKERRDRMSWEELRPIFRPEKVQTGKMIVDRNRCNGCRLCYENCPAKIWEFDEKGLASMKEVPGVGCISCYHCIAVCEEDAITIGESYHVNGGYWVTDPYPLPARLPLDPRDREGKPTEWNTIERAVYERRSVRNFEDIPVEETLIWRVIEAGRFAPSTGNCQPWKFIVITDRKMLREMEEAILSLVRQFAAAYADDEQTRNVLAPMYEADPSPGMFDPRVISGLKLVADGTLPVFLNAPVLILIACDDRAIQGREINAGICGQNMTLVANSLGIRSCWLGFSVLIEMIPPLKEKLGLRPPWTVTSGLVLGYPKFNQDGVVPREFRPVTWFREGAEDVELLEGPAS
jgi:nitroreductase/NAD-dependent dihydropyrimidine dehydrogenase PreA subunit